MGAKMRKIRKPLRTGTGSVAQRLRKCEKKENGFRGGVGEGWVDGDGAGEGVGVGGDDDRAFATSGVRIWILGPGAFRDEFNFIGMRVGSFVVMLRDH